MRRKVIKQGHNTFTLTLPIKWAKQQNLQPGTELEVSEQGNSLVVSILGSEGNEKAIEKAEVDITGLPNPLLWRFVSSAYRAGYNEIKIDFEGIENDKGQMEEFSYDITDWFYKGQLPKDRSLRLTPIEAIQALVNRFVGVEITEQRQNYVIVKQFGETSYKEFDHAMKRIFMVIVSMSKDVLSAIESNDRSPLKAIHMMDTNVDRFEDYCLRVLNTKGYEDYKKTSTVYSTIFLLEMLGDEYKRIAKHAVEEKAHYSQPALDFFRQVHQQLETYHELFYNFERSKAIKIFENEEAFTIAAKKLFEKGTDQDKELLHHLKKITRFIVSLAELAIDLKASGSPARPK